MKQSHFWPLLERFFLALGLGAAGCMCLATAFPMAVAVEHLLGCLALTALLGAVCYEFRLGWLAPLLVLGLAALSWEPLWESTKLLVSTLYGFYARAYHPAGTLTLTYAQGATATPALCLWGMVTVFVTAWTLARRQSFAAALMFSLTPLLLCLVVVDTPPETGWLLTLLGLLCILLLTQGCRRRSARQGAKLGFLLLLPVAALLLGLYALMPQGGYVRGAGGDALFQHLVDFGHRYLHLSDAPLGELPTTVKGRWSESLEIGPRRSSSDPVMQLRSSSHGTVYLRGLTYGVYTGTAWEQIPASAYPEGGHGLTVAGDGGQNLTVSIRTTGDQAVIYTPYYLYHLPQVGTALQDWGIENQERLRSYTVACGPAPLAPEAVASDYDGFVHQYYTQLPDKTRERAMAIALAWGLEEVDRERLPEILSNNVRNSARYDLDTPRMPRGSDFAIWFLEESGTGYCVHFATAQVVMLRAMGIPARYVTGYLCQSAAGVWRPVSEQNAHAWAEYYVDGVGWFPVEATPSDGVTDTAQGPTAPVADTSDETQESTTLVEGNHGSSSATEPSVEETSREAPGFGWIWWVLGALAIAILRRPVTLYLLRPRGPETNRRYLRDWRRANRLARYLGAGEACREVEGPCREAALKARFSQHTMDPADWMVLRRWRRGLLEELGQGRAGRRFVVRWVLVWDAGVWG